MYCTLLKLIRTCVTAPLPLSLSLDLIHTTDPLSHSVTDFFSISDKIEHYSSKTVNQKNPFLCNMFSE